jgi:lysophospholipase L1-like esterase
VPRRGWGILASVTRIRPAGAAILAALVVLATGASRAAAADPGPYVALGDSYTAAPLVLNQVGRPAGCGRSDNNYPSFVARALSIASLRDVSCSSATTQHMLAPQPVAFGINAPQFDGLRSDTRLVTIGIGGNDVGLVGAAVTCAQLGLTAPTGTACRSRFTAGGSDHIVAQIAATAPSIAVTIRGIRARSPMARILLVGYPAVLPRTGSGCYPLVPLSPDDVRYFDGLIIQTNTMLAEQAAANGAEFVDTYLDSVGHDVCTLPGTRWFEGLVPTAPAYPLHPNELGMQSMARSVLRVLEGPRPAPVLSELTRTSQTVRRTRTARFGYRLDRPATVSVVLRRRGANGRYAVVRRMAALGSAGENVLAIRPADFRRRAGLYRLTLTPRSDGLTGRARSVLFRVRR